MVTLDEGQALNSSVIQPGGHCKVVEYVSQDYFMNKKHRGADVVRIDQNSWLLGGRQGIRSFAQRDTCHGKSRLGVGVLRVEYKY